MNMAGMLRLAIVLASLAGAVAWSAGDSEALHGGIVQKVGKKSFELVVGPDGAELYVVDDGKDIVSSQMTAMLIIDVRGILSEVVMLSAGGNKYVASHAQIPKGARVVVQLIAADKSKTTARFKIK